MLQTLQSKGHEGRRRNDRHTGCQVRCSVLVFHPCDRCQRNVLTFGTLQPMSCFFWHESTYCSNCIPYLHWDGIYLFLKEPLLPSWRTSRPLLQTTCYFWSQYYEERHKVPTFVHDMKGQLHVLRSDVQKLQAPNHPCLQFQLWLSQCHLRCNSRCSQKAIWS